VMRAASRRSWDMSPPGEGSPSFRCQ
jgi:hypothetical protein